MKLHRHFPIALCIIFIGISTNEAKKSKFHSSNVLEVKKRCLSRKKELSQIDQRQEYRNYLKKYNKKYEDKEEMESHYKIYCKNVKKIEEHNKSNSSFKQGINKFTDMNNDEFDNGYLIHVRFSKFKRELKNNNSKRRTLRTNFN